MLGVCVFAVTGGVGAAPATLQVTGLALFAWASALIAGAVVPRRARAAGDDALSLASFAAVAVAVGGVIVVVGSRLEAVGVPGAVTGCIGLAGLAASAVTVLAATWGRR